jgi:hypothetical protein
MKTNFFWLLSSDDNLEQIFQLVEAGKLESGL